MKKLYLWEYSRITGYWKNVRDVSPETQEQWLEIFRKDNPSGIYKVSATRPSHVRVI